MKELEIIIHGGIFEEMVYFCRKIMTVLVGNGHLRRIAIFKQSNT